MQRVAEDKRGKFAYLMEYTHKHLKHPRRSEHLITENLYTPAFKNNRDQLHE